MAEGNSLGDGGAPSVIGQPVPVIARRDIAQRDSPGDRPSL